MTKTAIITGASSGIGRATAKDLAREGMNLILCGRRIQALEELQSELQDQCRVHILQFDVSDRKAVSKALEDLPKEFQKIDILINNAGNAHGLDPIHEGDLDDWEMMIDLNIKGLLYMTRAILPQMVERKKGHIINIGSLAGKETYPKGNIYSATKHAVDALNKSMRIDLIGKGIRVGAVNPGLVETGFSDVRFKGNTDRAKQTYKGYEPLKAEDIADIIRFVVTRPYHVNIADLLVLPTDQASSTVLNKEELQ